MTSTKEGMQKLLKRAGIYDRVKASFIYDCYWRVADKRIIDDRECEIEFYRNLLEGFQEGDLIFDIGANEGYKADIFLRLGARVVAVEPDETCQEVLRQRFLAYRIRKKPIEIVTKAASNRTAVETMLLDAPGSAKNTLSLKWAETLRHDATRFGHTLDFGKQKEVQTVTVEELITTYGLPFYIKIDVEGHEPNVLRGIRRSVPYVSFEVNLPEFKPEGIECIQLLRNLTVDGRFNYAKDCRRGLALDNWLEFRAFSSVFDSCAERSIEVFWKTPPGPRRP